MSILNTVRVIKFVRDDPDAVVPKRGTKYSIGFKKISDKTTLFDTGIKIQPPDGYYTEIVPRSSISKTGYMLSNSVGQIDFDFSGRLLIALTKVDESMPDITVPFTLCQLVLRKAEYPEMIEVQSLDETERGSGGFGSTSGNGILCSLESVIGLGTVPARK